jgi:hypothetical protein
LRRPRFGFGLALAGLGVAERGLLATFGGEDLRLLLTLGAQDLGGAQPSASRICARFSRSAFICRAIALDDVGGRADVLDLDPGDLDAPTASRVVDRR